jgi:CDP-glycerol glycerophosphotransferase (TagB/SpsB family)
MKYFKKLLVFCLDIFLNLFSLIIRRDNNIWLFGSWHGQKYDDNPKYLYEYVNKNYKNIRAIWITKNKKIIGDIALKGEVYYSYSLKGVYYSFKAGVVLFSHRVNDISFKGALYSANLVQLWHGMTIKKINYDTKIDNLKSFLERIMYGFEFKKYVLIPATSEKTRESLQQAFRTKNNIVQITGLPRNDELFKSGNFIKKELNVSKVITFMPTFRGEENSTDYLYMLKNESIEVLYNFLKETNTVLILKLHFHDRNKIAVPEKYKKLILFFDELSSYSLDTQSLLSETDILITDYSGCYIDYLLLNRPIIFSVPDLYFYEKIERGFNWDFSEITPGYKVENTDQLISALNDYFQNTDLDYKRRNDCLKEFHKFCDNNSSKRIVEHLQKITN